MLEVSSFQLETVEEFHPWIAVVLNITPDHLDRHGSFENYAAAKARIYGAAGGEDFLVLNAEDKPTQMVRGEDEGADVLVQRDDGRSSRGRLCMGERDCVCGEGGCEGGAGDAGCGDSAEGCAQRRECAGGGVCGAAGGDSGGE